MQELTFEQVEEVSGGSVVDGAAGAITGGGSGAVLFGAMKGLAKIGAIAAVGNPVGVALVLTGAAIGAVYAVTR